MKIRNLIWILVLTPMVMSLAFINDASREIELGRELFFDKSLSHPNGEACSVCHSPRTAFSDPFHAAVSEGMLTNAFVIRNSPSLTYCRYIGPLHYDSLRANWFGGLFWDGRSNSLEDQLSGPFFNHAEMNNADTAQLISEIPQASYFPLLDSLYHPQEKGEFYHGLINAIAAYERSDYLHSFSSKFDDVMDHQAEFSAEERKGWELFTGKAMCAQCHSITPNGTDQKILFTDYSYHNLGVPRNKNNPFYSTLPEINPLGPKAVDRGLGGVINNPKADGLFRTPSLRNVMETAPYFHNGFAPDIETALSHVLEHCINQSIPEIGVNVEKKWTGSVVLTTQEKSALIAFLQTLTDAY